MKTSIVPAASYRGLFLASAALAAIFASAAHAGESDALGAVAAAPGPESAYAALGSASLSEVVITAEKREANLQKTPIAISVAGAQDLENRRVQSLADLGDGAIPSLRIAPFFSRNSALTVGIRGIVPGDANQPSRDAVVGVYMDGVYLGRSQGLGAALFDIDRIEVLKGPQGALFGRNAVGGALNIVSKKPSGEFGLRQLVGVRNFGGYSAETHLDLPRVADVSLKFDAILARRDGSVKNPMAGEHDFNSFDRRGVHLRALWQPTDRLTADYGFDVSKDDTTPYYQQLIGLNPGAPALAPAVMLQPSRAKTADIGVPEQLSEGNTSGHVLTLTWKAFEGAEVRSISSYRRVKQTQYDNGGGHSARFTPNGLFSRYSLAALHQEQYSEELQLVGSTPRLAYVAGLYYYHEDGEDWAWTPNTLQWNATGTAYTRLPTLEAGQQTPFPDRLSTAVARSEAVYGQVTWTPPLLADALHLTVGGRYTKDRKHGALLRSQGAPTPYTFHLSGSRFDPTVTAAYDVTEGVNLYVKWATAYRAGGANSRSLIYRSFGPEKVATTEVGLKSEFLDRRVRLNLAAYDTRYKDIQVDFSAVNFVAGRNIGTLETVNTSGTGKIRGFEADVAFVPVENLTLSASYAYTDPKLPLAPNPFANGALSKTYVVFTPKNAFSVAADYDAPISWGRLIAHLDVNHQGPQHGLSTEAAVSQKATLVNARLAISEIQLREDARLQLSLWSRNLLNEDHAYLVTTSAALNGRTGLFNEPRTYGFDATIEF